MKLQIQAIALCLLLCSWGITAQNVFVGTWDLTDSTNTDSTSTCCYYNNDVTITGSSATAGSATGPTTASNAGCTPFTGATNAALTQTLTVSSSSATSGTGATASTWTVGSDQLSLTYAPTQVGSGSGCSQTFTRTTTPVSSFNVAGVTGVWAVSQSAGGPSCCFMTGSLTFASTTSATTATGTRATGTCGGSYSQVLKAGTVANTAVDFAEVQKFTYDSTAGTMTYQPSVGCTQVFTKTASYTAAPSSVAATWPVSQTSGGSCCFVLGTLTIATNAASVMKASGALTGTGCSVTVLDDALKTGPSGVTATDLTGTRKYTVSSAGSVITYEPSANCVQTFAKAAPTIANIGGTWPSTSTDGSNCCFISGNLIITSSGTPVASGTKTGTPCVGSIYDRVLIAGTSPVTATDLLGVETFTLSGDNKILTYKPSASCTQVFTKPSTDSSGVLNVTPSALAVAVMLGLVVV